MADAFYKMDFRAWNMGTVDLTLELEAAFLRLCHAMYDVAGPIPNSPRMLAGLFRCHQNKATKLLRELIDAGKICLTEGGQLFNNRVRQELHTRETLRTQRRDAGETGGRRSGDARRNTLKDNDQAEAIASTLRTREEQRRGEAPNGAAGAGAHGHTHTHEGKPDLAKQFEARVLAASTALNAAYARSPGLYDLSPVHRWLAAGYDLEADILPPVLAHFARGATVPRSWAYFQAAVTEAAEKRAAMTPKPFEPARGPTFPFDERGRRLKDGPHVTVYFGTLRHPGELHLADAVNARSNWIAAVKAFRKTGEWCRQLLGPTPDEPGHHVPARAIERADEAAVTPEQFDAIMNRHDTGESQPHARRHH